MKMLPQRTTQQLWRRHSTNDLAQLGWLSLIVCLFAWFHPVYSDAEAETYTTSAAAKELLKDRNDARSRYNQYCSGCHGYKGEGGPAADAWEPHPRILADDNWQNCASDEKIYQAINEGGPSVGLSFMMPAFGNLFTDKQIRELVAVVRTFGDVGKKTEADLIDGGIPTIYSEMCSACHGGDGMGQGPTAIKDELNARNFVDLDWQKSVTDDDIRQVLRHGGASRGLNNAMPAFGQILDPVMEEMIAYVRSFAPRSPVVDQDNQ